MIISQNEAKRLCFNKWERTLHFLRKHPKCETYGISETADTIWEKLPKLSKQFWIDRATYNEANLRR